MEVVTEPRDIHMIMRQEAPYHVMRGGGEGEAGVGRNKFLTWREWTVRRPDFGKEL